MVLANKVTLILTTMLVACTATPKIEARESCNQKKQFSELMSRPSSWAPVARDGNGHELMGDKFFFPFMGLKIYEGKMYVSTYNLDYSPVNAKLTPDKSGALVEGVRFLSPPQHVPGDINTQAIRFYSSPKINYAVTYGENCGIDSNSLRVSVFYDGYVAGRKEDESILLRRTE